jgi:hypothetical protein
MGGRDSNLFNNVVVNINGWQRIWNMICFMSSKQEIVIMMACKYIYLHQGGPFYKSHEFSMLFIKHLLDILMNVNIVRINL